MTVIAVDVDDTCAGLVNTWLRKYNQDFNDNVTINDIKEWDISRFVKCGGEIYGYLTSRLYDDVYPVCMSAFIINSWRKNLPQNRIIFATKPTELHRGRKLRWLYEWGFFSGITENDAKKDYIELGDKSLIRADIIIDDCVDNCVDFSEGTRPYILFDRPWNKNHEVMPGSIRAFDWSDVNKAIINFSETGRLFLY